MEYYERLTAQDSERLAQLLDEPNQRRRERLQARIERAQAQFDTWLDKMAVLPNISLVVVEKQRRKAQAKINKLKQEAIK
jgi:chromosome segregation ATPase